MEEALAHLDQAIQSLQQEILRLRKQGVRAGAIESYPRGERTYYNHTYYERGRPIRRYLPLKQKAQAEAEDPAETTGRAARSGDCSTRAGTTDYPGLDCL